MGGSQANTSPSDSSTLLANPRQSVYDPSTLRPSSIYRPQSPILSSMPESAFSQAPGIYVSAAPPGGPTTSASLGPHAVTAHGAPIWPGLGPQSGQPSMPSPALTEVSSFATPEGLLNPSLALRLGAQGMQSQGALSFRDDMDYSRPIGGMVNNRQHSRTTLHTMSTESRRRPSLESRDTQGTHTTGTETVHPFAEAASPPTSGRASTEGSSVHS
ncbi:hypothetical protein C8Q78DRAFT_967160 [Trametes maxima]|nr:hypothetical protein C8Q78DRAFT_967160 [Trametes maxima]